MRRTPPWPGCASISMSSRRPDPRPDGAECAFGRRRNVRHIAYYLRHPGNLHYFASVRPYLDRLRRNRRYRHHLVVADGLEQVAAEAEYEGYGELFTDAAQLDAYDLVLTRRPFCAPTSAARVPGRCRCSTGCRTSRSPMSGISATICCACAPAGARETGCARTGGTETWTAPSSGIRNSIDSRPSPGSFEIGKSTLIYCPTWRKEGISSIELLLDSPETIRTARPPLQSDHQAPSEHLQSGPQAL